MEGNNTGRTENSDFLHHYSSLPSQAMSNSYTVLQISPTPYENKHFLYYDPRFGMRGLILSSAIKRTYKDVTFLCHRYRI
jgi:hypothetical protein